MSTIDRARRRNLAALVREVGSATAVAKLLGHTSPGFISQMMSGKREVSEKTARKIEQATGKPELWMDMNRPEVVLIGGLFGKGQESPPGAVSEERATYTVDPSFVGGSVKLVASLAQEFGVKLPPEKMAAIVDMVYTSSIQKGALDEDLARAMVRLML